MQDYKFPPHVIRHDAARALLSISIMQAGGVDTGREVSAFFSKFQNDGLKLEKYLDSGKVNHKGALFIHRETYYNIYEYQEPVEAAAKMLAKAGVGRMKSDFIIRTFADNENNGTTCLGYKISILEQTTREPPKSDGIVLYPGSHLDFHHGVLVDANRSKYRMIDPLVGADGGATLAFRQLSALSSGGGLSVSLTAPHAMRVGLSAEGMAFNIHSQEFFVQDSSADTANFNGWGDLPFKPTIKLSHINEPVASVIIKKPNMNLYESIDPARGLGRLMDAIVQGGYFLYADFLDRVEPVAKAVAGMGMKQVSEGELYCDRVCSGSDMEETYSAVLFRKG